MQDGTSIREILGIDYTDEEIKTGRTIIKRFYEPIEEVQITLYISRITGKSIVENTLDGTEKEFDTREEAEPYFKELVIPYL